ncbi:hypothetical protein N657DRAFT_681014 [Parathielavia appendiculata]|uniref:RNase MRP protein 1 RNA binding domain-containing protein n=1 Tax=Parathielavia appendiculata TaxID=2587402 RepID=A0AAN6U285_9PEZI|nr:hypothetical protein N657DRAFT_681014 [Parathielavia appendiculata]
MAEPGLGKDTDLPPTLDSAILTPAIASLAPALELLERFHHRNKNQHRISKWWAQADMLRRHIWKMLGELEAAVEAAERTGRVRERQRVKGKRKEKEQVKKVGERGQGEGEGRAVRKRAGYLRWKLGPGAFLAFTQLSADRQFAHLGLMLLGVLAQVDKAVAPFAPAPPSQTGDETGEQASAASAASAEAVQPAAGQDNGVGADSDAIMEVDTTDKGVAVCRDEIMASIERDTASTPIPPAASSTQQLVKGDTHPRSLSLPINRPSRTQQPLSQTPAARTEPTSKEASITSDVFPSKPKTKKTVRPKDEFDDIFGSMGRPPTGNPKPPATADTPAREPSSKEASASCLEAALKPKKKVREDKAGGGARGDGLDDIFASLDAKSKKPKKKRKKGDEFDDIFGGL